jgi:uncharacterized protein (TIGR02996 family)
VDRELFALLEAIRTNPEDDLPRLALSDWCMEQDDPILQARGEFIQLRCRAAVLPLDAAERTELTQRMNNLRCNHEESWLGGLAKLLVGWDFERGMTLVQVTSDSLRAASLDSFSTHPGWAWVIGVRGLLLQANEIARLLASQQFNQLTSLDLRDCPLRVKGANALAAAATTQRLAALHLDYCQLGDRGLTALINSPRLKRLTTLTLGCNDLTKEGARVLADSPFARGIVELDLSRNRLGDDGARALVSSGMLEKVERLNLESCELTDRSGMRIAGAMNWKALRWLDLRNNRFAGAMKEQLRERYGERVFL